MKVLEKTMAYSPPLIFSKIEGIESKNGIQAEGWIITVGGTPKEILSHKPEFSYRRLITASKMAKKLGAKIMGLGAFTKVVGDAGITVAEHSPIPITTGNSYSASATLWAAAEGTERLGLVTIPEGNEKLRMRNIHLPKNLVFACMAETIVLALEGRFEEYTIGRDIDWKKVKEIYKLGLKHGMKLAAISGLKGAYNDEDINRIRDLALKARMK